MRRPFVTPQSPWRRESAIWAGPWCLPQKLDCSNSIFFFSLSLTIILPPLPSPPLRFSLLSFLASPGYTKIIGDMHQSILYLSHQNWDWNSNLRLALLISFSCNHSQPQSKCYLTIPFSVAFPHFLFLPLKGDPYCCHRRDESFFCGRCE